ncbi:cellulose synthase operon protein YhjQ/BcsQ [Actinomyces howellii]|uniref:Flp pilus assembly protein, ATPase CpaE n=1 Tax=Actinomyces howellii TaxID=52771 RepID=A0A3S4R1R6_9ACTO|nr:cellulose synthase operon protein YhjQ/BcsQ [Actinomyces howellii]VEG29164.1 Flp pilus assembly protein, ATPase CpaE [Actinomyces howellii]
MDDHPPDSPLALAPGVRVLVPSARPGTEGTSLAPGAGSGLDPNTDRLVRACTSHAPLSCPLDADPLLEARRVLKEGRAEAVVVLLPGEAVDAAPTGERVVVGSLEECAGADGSDALVALLLAAQDPPRARVLALTGARGGLGTSTFLLHVARSCSARGQRVALLDADPAGGLGLLIGADLLPGLYWADLPDGEAAFRPERLVSALPTWLGMPVLTGDGRGGPASPEALVPALEALRARHDLVVVDLPRGAPAPPGSTVLLVSALDLRSAVAAEALSRRLRQAGGHDDLHLLVRLDGEDVSAEELSVMVGAPVLATIVRERAVAQRIAHGDDPTRGRGRLRTQSRRVAARLLGAGQAGPGRDEGASCRSVS